MGEFVFGTIGVVTASIAAVAWIAMPVFIAFAGMRGETEDIGEKPYPLGLLAVAAGPGCVALLLYLMLRSIVVPLLTDPVPTWTAAVDGVTAGAYLEVAIAAGLLAVQVVAFVVAMMLGLYSFLGLLLTIGLASGPLIYRATLVALWSTLFAVTRLSENNRLRKRVIRLLVGEGSPAVSEASRPPNSGEGQ